MPFPDDNEITGKPVVSNSKSHEIHDEIVTPDLDMSIFDAPSVAVEKMTIPINDKLESSNV